MNSIKSPNFFNIIISFFKNIFFGITIFLMRVKKSILVMSPLEKKLALFFFVVSIVLLGIKTNQLYNTKTRPVPTVGGSYKEAVAGELKFLSPVSVASDIDQSISSLIFSSLIKFDENGNIVYDVAKSHTISEDGLTYTFVLRDDVLFHNGDKMTAMDIVYTLTMIQRLEMQSPMYNQWKDIEITQTADDVVAFVLPKAYGPFIYGCDFGILPSAVSSDDFSKKIIGSGPYKYDSAKKNGLNFTTLKLERNENYYGLPYNIKTIEFSFFKDSVEAVTAFESGEFTGLFGAVSSANNGSDFSFDTSRRLALIPNLRSNKLKDEILRKKIFSGEVILDQIELSLTALDAPPQNERVEKIKNQLALQNIIISVKSLSIADFKKALDSKNYELLLYGFDFSRDRDSYAYWHTSELDNQNYAGYSDLKSDILLEDARMSQDIVARNVLYDQFFAKLTDQAMIVLYDPIKFNFVIDQKAIKGVKTIVGTEPSSRFGNLNQWYTKEKRVRQ